MSAKQAERKEAKCKCDQSVQGNKEERNQQYASLGKKVKKSCKKDKKAFIKKKETEVEEATKKNDSKMLLNSNNKMPIKDKQGKVSAQKENKIKDG